MTARPAPAQPAGRPSPTRTDATRADIITEATAEFAEKGLSGASVNAIAARTRTSKPMIYYHFQSKEGLYAAVMEAAYGRMREVEQALQLDHLTPVDALRQLVEATFDHHADDPHFVRLISIENIHQARHIAHSPTLGHRNAVILEIVANLLARGVRTGDFRPGIDPVDLHLLISSICFYRVSNRHTWAILFDRDLQAHLQAHRTLVVEAVLGYLRPT